MRTILVCVRTQVAAQTVAAAAARLGVAHAVRTAVTMFEALARLVGRGHWLTDTRFATSEARRDNFDAMAAELAALFLERDAADWERDMSQAGIPCGMVALGCGWRRAAAGDSGGGRCVEPRPETGAG